MTHLHLDFETRSLADLRKVGAHVYARDPSTEVLCMAYAFDDEPVELWIPRTWSLPERVDEHVRDGGLVYAHNAAFEFALWNGILETPESQDAWPLKHSQMRCTMAMAYAMGLPGSLEEAAAAAGIHQRKDVKGHRVMMQLCKPRRIEEDGTPVWWDDPGKYEALYAYCKQDVEVERELAKRLMPLSPAEQHLWEVDQEINARGVAVDLDAIETGLELIDAETKRLNQEMRAATAGAVSTCTAVGQLTDWLKWKGLVLDGVAKADVAELLTRDDLPDDVRAGLLLRQEAAKSSTAKLKKMQSLAGHDGRVRGGLQYHGAATGRWAARGMQMQNMPRPAILHEEADVADAIDHFNDPAYLDMLYGSPLQVLSDCLRGLIVAAPGNELIAADFSNIEGRVLAWLAGEKWKLKAYADFDRGIGPDLYLVSAARIYKCGVDEAKPHRQVGKVSELACGFGGGVGAFQKMARNYGLDLTDDEAEEVKTKWREAHARIVDFWKQLETAAIRAVRDGGIQHAGKIAYRVRGSFLWCQLPSKRVLCYPYPEVHEKEMPWSTPEKPAWRPALTYMAVNGITRKWERCDTYGGSLSENVTQAVARDLLANAILKANERKLDVVFHVHDELVVEAPLRALTVDDLTTLMCDLPEWADGLPVAATGYAAHRYRKD